MTVPRLPITRSRLPTADRLAAYLKEIDQNRRHANFGPLHQRFVAALESHVCDGRVALAASGSLGLMLALKASGVEGGGLCAMPSWTYVATRRLLAPRVLRLGFSTWIRAVGRSILTKFGGALAMHRDRSPPSWWWHPSSSRRM